jgi:hypothetical protein
MLNVPSLWDGRARKYKSMILQRQKQSERYKAKNKREKQGKVKTAKITACKG